VLLPPAAPAMGAESDEERRGSSRLSERYNDDGDADFGPWLLAFSKSNCRD
jgi:hypothetical protein